MFFKKKKKFLEGDNTAVFTTTFVVQDKEVITYVTHEEDGAWQFFSNEKFEDYEDVAMIVSLKEVVTADPSLLELADMPVGHMATRGERNEPWVISKKPN